MSRSLMLLISLLLTTATHGADTTRAPIRISADNVVVNQTTLSSVYSGNVLLEQGEMRMEADQLKVFTKNKRLERLEATGAPATLRNLGTDGIPVEGFAYQIDYQATNGDVVFTGDARLIQADNTVESQSIRYNLNQGTLKAGGRQSGDRVEVILLPAE